MERANLIEENIHKNGLASKDKPKALSVTEEN